MATLAEEEGFAGDHARRWAQRRCRLGQAAGKKQIGNCFVIFRWSPNLPHSEFFVYHSWAKPNYNQPAHSRNTGPKDQCKFEI